MDTLAVATRAVSPRSHVPFFRPVLTEDEIAEVVETLRSGWLTTGPRVARFESDFAAAVNAPHAVAVNSCTAALHLALHALGLRAGEGVLVPTMTFAATAEVVAYHGAIPVLVDCDPVTGNMDLADAERKLVGSRQGALRDSPTAVVGIVPVHVGGLMLDMSAVGAFARRHGLWVVEDAAHAFPAAWRPDDASPWQRCGENTAAVTCFSFYANKTITTGEGGMAVTGDGDLARRMRLMSLHGLSHDAWNRYGKGGQWDYRIIAPGYKYNLTDVAAAIGIHQLKRAELMRRQRARIASIYTGELGTCEALECPIDPANRVHAWHLYPVRLRLERLAIGRNEFIDELRDAGIGCSVHWRPLHLHPYYQERFGTADDPCPSATAMFARLISLPLFPAMDDEEIADVVNAVKDVAERHRRS